MDKSHSLPHPVGRAGSCERLSRESKRRACRHVVGCSVSIENILPSALIHASRNQVADELRRSGGAGLPSPHRAAQPFGLLLQRLEGQQTDDTNVVLQPATLGTERLLNAREVAESLGVSERWVRDHTTRRSPRIRGIKLGTLIRYRRADVETFMEMLDTQAPSRPNRFRV